MMSLDLLHNTGLAELASPLVEAGVLARELLFVVDRLGQRLGEARPEHLLWVALLLEAGQRGHSALPTGDLARYLPPRADAEDPAWPALPPTLGSGPLFATDPPLVTLTEGVLQSHRMATEEQWLADGLRALTERVDASLDGFLRPSADCVARGTARFGDPDHPGCGALKALVDRRLAIITGGPGTGKTWSIKRVLAMLLEAAQESDVPLVVRLAAPTGKAGVRMREAMAEGLDDLDVSEAIRERLRSLESATLHRLLRIRPGESTSRFGPDQPLPVDVVIVDEASMVDLPLMRRLVQAIGPRTRLVLLGDRDQLPSVDVGSVFSDLVARPLAALADPTVQGGSLSRVMARFSTNHRSGQAPSLARLITALQDDGNAGRTAALPLLAGQDNDEFLADRIGHVEPSGHGGRLSPQQLDALVAPWAEDHLVLGSAGTVGRHAGYLALLSGLLNSAHWSRDVAERIDDLLAAFDRYRVLAVHRRGPAGVSGLTRAVEARVRERLELARPERRLPQRAGKWLGQAVLVTRNAYDIDLWNGDVGLVLPDPNDDLGLAVAFPTTNPVGGRSHRFVALDRLPEHEGAFVLTVHKSQGSQFDHVALVLADRPSPIETRELVYTGISRASQRVTWVGTLDAMGAALARPVVRGSRLGERLV